MDKDYNKVAMVSYTWVLMAYFQMPYGPTAAMTSRSLGHQKWVDHIFVNMMEQAPMFLTSLWTFSLMVSAKHANRVGMIYLGVCALYAPIWLFLGGKGGPLIPYILVSTFPQYSINIYFAFTVVLKVAFGIDLKSSDVIGFCATTFAFLVYAISVTAKVNVALTGFFAKLEEAKKD